MSKEENDCNIYVNGRFLTRNITGVERFSIEITRELISIHPNIKIIAPRKTKQQTKFDQSKMIYTGIFSGHFWEQIILPVFLIRKRRAVLLNFANTAPVLYAKKITTLHDTAFKDHPEWFSIKFAKYYNFLVPKLIASSKHILTVSEFSRQKITEIFNVDASKVSVIYNGVSSAFAKHKPTNKPFDFDYYLTVGTLQPRKNIIRLLEAYKQIPDPKSKLVIVGNIHKNFKNSSNILKRSDPNIIIKQNVNDGELAALYKYAKKFIYPSLYEGFGLPVLEALHFSCPVVASNIPVFKELFGNCIDYFDPYTVESIKKGIERKPILNKDATLIKQIKNYNFAASAKQILEIIEEKKDSICA